jgi:regulator of protease activity HflC (stomatin/prohibitin superfamily)
MQPSTDSNKGLIITGVIVGFLLLFFLFCFRVVAVGQVGIVTRLGHINREAPSGVVIKAPWPIERLIKMDIRTQKEQQDADAATHDLQSVSTTLALNYHLTPATARVVYENIGTDYKIRVIDPILQEAVKSVTAKYDASELISQRPEVEAKLTDHLVSKLASRGITVDNVSIVNFRFSAVFDRAIEQKQVAQQNAQKAQYQLQTARLTAQSQDVQAKTLTPQYLQLQAIEKWNGKLPTYVSTNGSIFGIPLQVK